MKRISKVHVKPITIAPATSLPLKAAVGIFIATFGATWLLFEPLGFFGLLPPLDGIAGAVAYAAMILCAVLSVPVSRYAYGRWSGARMTYVEFRVSSSSDGADYLVRAPTNMQVWDFTHQFLRHLSRGPGGERIVAKAEFFDPVLQVKAKRSFVDLDSGDTLKQAGIARGAHCRIRANPHRRMIAFSRSPR